MLFYIGLLSFIMAWRFIPVVAHIYSLFLLIAERYGYTTVGFSIHLLMEIWVPSVQLL